MISIPQVEIAARAWLESMRRQWVTLHPGETCPIKSWDTYKSEDQAVLLKAARSALSAAGPTK